MRPLTRLVRKVLRSASWSSFARMRRSCWQLSCCTSFSCCTALFCDGVSLLRCALKSPHEEEHEPDVSGASWTILGVYPSGPARAGELSSSGQPVLLVPDNFHLQAFWRATSRCAPLSSLYLTRRSIHSTIALIKSRPHWTQKRARLRRDPCMWSCWNLAYAAHCGHLTPYGQLTFARIKMGCSSRQLPTLTGVSAVDAA